MTPTGITEHIIEGLTEPQALRALAIAIDNLDADVKSVRRLLQTVAFLLAGAIFGLFATLVGVILK